MKIYKTQKGSVENLYSESLDEYFDEDDYHKRLKFISDEFDKEVEGVEERLKNNYFKKSCLHRIFKVHERVRLVRHFEDQLSQGMDILPKFMYPGLGTYLLLTCFDQLGQHKDWVSFMGWLEAKKCKDERDNIFKNAKFEENITNTDGNANSKYFVTVHKKYNEIYGVKNSFMNFLKNLLPQEQRDELLNKIRIEIYSVDDNNNMKFEKYTGEFEKENWLYTIRNNYTHNLITVEKHYIIGYFEIEDNWEIREEIHKKTKVQRILVRESFKKEIEKSILIGIVETIKNNSK